MSDLAPAARTLLLALGFIALLLGIAGGLVRLGLPLPAAAAGIAWHGALMASAFFGTLIALERAVAIGRRWAYLAPAACGAGGLVLLAGYARTGFALLAAGSAVLALVSSSIWWRHKALHTGLLALGALGLLAANLALLAGMPAESSVPCWIAFFALTIGGERLELSRLSPVPPAARGAFAALGAALLLSAFAALASFVPALRVGGALLVACALWLARYDIATRTLRAAGLTRYIALCLLAGYAWLAIGGALLASGAVFDDARALWDAALHAILLGFVFSMVFGHAPVILPAVLRVALPYSPILYLPLALLHVSLAIRLAGDLGTSTAQRAAGGAGNALAIAVFILTAAALALSRSSRVRSRT
ncbi:MAG TPA: hypothetical protein VLX30_04130 [Burkholderiales bacterium]|nr:hypothetical protein [Burkholderiales bacterium]